MAYDLGLTFAPALAASPVSDRRDDFRRFERVVVLTGASALGAIGGVAAALCLGRLDLWMIVASAAPLWVFALYLTFDTARDAMRRNAIGCASAACMHAAALLSWPMTSLLIPLGAANYWIAPVLAMATLFLFASCWSGSVKSVYRLCAQGMMIGALAAHQGTLLILG